MGLSLQYDFTTLDFLKDFDVLPWHLMGVDISLVLIFLTISWGVWKYRNRSLIENSDSNILNVVDSCLGYVDHYNIIRKNQLIVGKEKVFKRQPPPCGKVNEFRWGII